MFGIVARTLQFLQFLPAFSHGLVVVRRCQNNSTAQFGPEAEGHRRQSSLQNEGHSPGSHWWEAPSRP
jgi:hypothetical protein